MVSNFGELTPSKCGFRGEMNRNWKTATFCSRYSNRKWGILYLARFDWAGLNGGNVCLIRGIAYKLKNYYLPTGPVAFASVDRPDHV